MTTGAPWVFAFATRGRRLAVSSAVLFLLTALAEPGAFAAPGPTPSPPAGGVDGARRYVFSLSSGGSRGAFQAGAMYAVLAHLRANRADSTRATTPLGAPVGFSGVSSGGLNAVASALSWCLRDDEPLGVDRNPLWDAWRTLSWEAFFPGDATCAEYAEAFPELGVACAQPDGPAYTSRDGILTLRALADLRRQMLMSLTESKHLGACNIPVTLTLNAETPAPLSLGDYKLSSSRRITAFELRGRLAPVGAGQQSEGATLDICEPDLDEPFTHSSTYVGLPLSEPERGVAPSGAERSCRRVSLPGLLDAVTAGAAFPVLFAPQPLYYCGTSCEHAETTGLYCPDGRYLCQGRFSDGSLFDQQPLSGAVEIARAAAIAPAPGMTPPPLFHLLVGSKFQRPENDSPDRARTPPPPNIRGYDFYSAAASNFFEVAGQYEIQTLARYGQLGGPHAEVGAVTRRFTPVANLRVFNEVPALGTFLEGTSAFFDTSFRRFDYYLGIYEGLYWLARASCPTAVCNDWPTRLVERASRIGVFASRGAATVVKKALEAEIRIEHQRAPLEAANILRTLSLDRRLSEQSLAQEAQSRLSATRPVALRGELQGIRNDEAMEEIWNALNGPGADQVPDRDSFAAFASRLDKDEFGNGDKPAFIRDTQRWRFDTLRTMLARLESIERQDGDKTTAAGLAFAQYMVAVEASRHDDAWVSGISTIPERALRSTRLALLQKLVLPYTVTFDWTHGGLAFGWELLSYRPAAAPVFRFQLPAPNVHYFREVGAAETRWNVGLPAGISLMFGPHWWNLGSTELGVRAGPWWVPGRAAHSDTDRFDIGSELFVRPFFGRVEISASYRDVFCRRHQSCGDALSINLGLSDVNGLVYWIVRAVTGSEASYDQLTRGVVSASGVPLP
jgi:hypothetical protein